MAATHPASVMPGRKPIKDWNATADREALERMQAICRKRADVPKTEQPIALKVQEQTEQKLCWNLVNPYLWLSACKHYQIHRERVGDYTRDDGLVIREGVEKYQAWKAVPWFWYLRLGPFVASLETAQGLCEAQACKP